MLVSRLGEEIKSINEQLDTELYRHDGDVTTTFHTQTSIRGGAPSIAGNLQLPY